MKTLEEIKQMAEEFTNENSGHYHYRGKESFIKGYTQCQEDMFDSLLANKLRSLYGNDDKKYTEEDMRQIFEFGLMNPFNDIEVNNDNFEYFINSLNKQN
jgi:hypothetical protein